MAKSQRHLLRDTFKESELNSFKEDFEAILQDYLNGDTFKNIILIIKNKSEFVREKNLGLKEIYVELHSSSINQAFQGLTNRKSYTNNLERRERAKELGVIKLNNKTTKEICQKFCDSIGQELVAELIRLHEKDVIADERELSYVRGVKDDDVVRATKSAVKKAELNTIVNQVCDKKVEELLKKVKTSILNENSIPFLKNIMLDSKNASLVLSTDPVQAKEGSEVVRIIDFKKEIQSGDMIEVKPCDSQEVVKGRILDFKELTSKSLSNDGVVPTTHETRVDDMVVITFSPREGDEMGVKKVVIAHISDVKKLEG